MIGAAAAVVLSCAPPAGVAPSPAPACRLILSAPTGEVGFAAEVPVRAAVACDGGGPPPEIVWDDGTRGPERVVRTPPLEDVIVLRDRAGLLPISPAQGTVRVRARAGGASADAEIVAAFPQSGVPSVPLGVSAYVYGGPGGAVQRVVPTAPETDVHDARTGFRLRLTAGRPDARPQDCHRSECHPTELAALAATRHATALDRALAAPADTVAGAGAQAAGCPGCHASGGASGVPGGFADVARALGWWPLPAYARTLEDLPRDLQRLSGVTCFACHGPAPLPEGPARPAIWGTGVCAQCHDSPPRYTTVQQWQGTRKALLRPFAHEPECSGCHTAQGFVVRLGVIRALAPEPTSVEPVTCAACHDPHGASSANPKMMRGYDTARGGASAVCSDCHRADLGVEAARRVALRLAPMAPQSELAPADCVRCHAPHGFRAAAPTAAERETAERISTLAERARVALRAKLVGLRGCNRAAGSARDLAVVRDRIAIVDGQGHALGDCDGDGRFKEGGREDPLVSSKLAAAIYRRAYDLLTVERDRSRGLHNPERAERMLQAALAEEAP